MIKSAGKRTINFTELNARKKTVEEKHKARDISVTSRPHGWYLKPGGLYGCVVRVKGCI